MNPAVLDEQGVPRCEHDMQGTGDHGPLVHSVAPAQTVLATSKIAMLFQRDVQCFCSMPSRHLNRSLNSFCSCGSPASSRKGFVAQMVPFGAGTMQCSAITTMISAQSTFSECLDVVSSCLLSVQTPWQRCKALQVTARAQSLSREGAQHMHGNVLNVCANAVCKCACHYLAVSTNAHLHMKTDQADSRLLTPAALCEFSAGCRVPHQHHKETGTFSARCPQACAPAA